MCSTSISLSSLFSSIANDRFIKKSSFSTSYVMKTCISTFPVIILFYLPSIIAFKMPTTRSSTNIKRNLTLNVSKSPGDASVPIPSIADTPDSRQASHKEDVNKEDTSNNINFNTKYAIRRAVKSRLNNHGTSQFSSVETMEHDETTILKTPSRKVTSNNNSRKRLSESTPSPSPQNIKSPKLTTPNKSPKSPRRQRIEPGSLKPPLEWESIYTLVEELRSDRTAPCDGDGAEALPQRHLGDKIFRFQVLIALMLSSQTKDAVVGETMKKLQKYGLDVENIHGTSMEALNLLIQKVGFHNNKAKYIKEAVKIMIEQYEGDIPPTADEIMTLPGVGPKMAYIVENIVFQKASGIGVDTHMHRLFNDLKWVKSNTPEQTREQLEGWLPRNKWLDVNLLFVGFGQETQQQKEKVLRKALVCSRPKDALRLFNRVGLDVSKESKKYGLEEEVKKILSQK